MKDKEAGTFVVRDSTSYRGSFGLAMKVDQTSANHTATTTHPGKLLLGAGARHNNSLSIKRSVQCLDRRGREEATKTQIQTMRVHCSCGGDVPMCLRTAENHLLNPADVKGQVQLFVESAVISSTHSKHCVNTKENQLFMTL